VEGALQRAYLRATPGVSHIRNPDDGLAPGVTGRRKELARLSVGIRRRATGHLEGAARRLGVQPRRGVGDYAADLRRQGGALLLGILLEPRTLERGQLRPEPVRRMIDATLGGRRPFTHVLGLLVTLELFQRQFLDGEHFPASTVAPEEPLRAVEPSPA
jgi:hypothetical protein